MQRNERSFALKGKTSDMELASTRARKRNGNKVLRFAQQNLRRFGGGKSSPAEQAERPCDGRKNICRQSGNKAPLWRHVKRSHSVFVTHCAQVIVVGLKYLELRAAVVLILL